jgi:hypothetical protein
MCRSKNKSTAETDEGSAEKDYKNRKGPVHRKRRKLNK